ncbi:hypothetical protein [Streptomyces hokutonensis]|uniref:Uncharacterized protein n=1 Tax=Streptomyces hokutonensis TaxID=1306990 RepID=A0ABW6M5J6_9ACTN
MGKGTDITAVGAPAQQRTADSDGAAGPGRRTGLLSNRGPRSTAARPTHHAGTRRSGPEPVEAAQADAAQVA